MLPLRLVISFRDMAGSIRRDWTGGEWTKGASFYLAPDSS
jgi:hypothetical protein